MPAIDYPEKESHLENSNIFKDTTSFAFSKEIEQKQQKYFPEDFRVTVPSPSIVCHKHSRPKKSDSKASKNKKRIHKKNKDKSKLSIKSINKAIINKPIFKFVRESGNK